MLSVQDIGLSRGREAYTCLMQGRDFPAVASETLHFSLANYAGQPEP